MRDGRATLISSSGLVVWRLAVTLRTGYAEYLAANPPLILLSTMIPRAVFQCLFFTLLGGVAAGESGREFAFIGSVAMVMMLSTLVGVCDVPMLEKWSGTFFRIQLGVLRPAVTYFVRTLPWVAEAVVTATVCVVVVGPLTGQADTAVALLGRLPLFCLIAVTSASAGTAAAAFAVGRRADVLIGNAFAYVSTVAAGILVPIGTIPRLDIIGMFLPMRNGLHAIRNSLEGRPWLGNACAEVVVGAAWLLVAWLAYHHQSGRSRRLGIDDYT
jgi:hypothetical protein